MSVLTNTAVYQRLSRWGTLERTTRLEQFLTWGADPLVVPALVLLSSEPGDRLKNFSRDFSRYLMGAANYYITGFAVGKVLKALGVDSPHLQKLGGFLVVFTINALYKGVFSIKLSQNLASNYKKNKAQDATASASGPTQVANPNQRLLPQQPLYAGMVIPNGPFQAFRRFSVSG